MGDRVPVPPFAQGPLLRLRLSCPCGAAVWYAEEALAQATAWMESHRESCAKKKRGA